MRTCNGHVKPRSISNPTGAGSRLTGSCACETTLHIQSNLSRIKTHRFMCMWNHAPNQIQLEQDQDSQVHVHVKTRSKLNPTGAGLRLTGSWTCETTLKIQSNRSKIMTHRFMLKIQLKQKQGPQVIVYVKSRSKSNPTGAGLRLTGSWTCGTTLQIYSNRRRNKSHRFMYIWNLISNSNWSRNKIHRFITPVEAEF